MRDERARISTSRLDLQHWGFNFQTIAAVEEVANVADDLASGTESLTHVRIHDHIDIAMPIASFHIGETIPTVRQRLQRFTEQLPRRYFERKLAPGGASDCSGGADEVAFIEQP